MTRMRTLRWSAGSLVAAVLVLTAGRALGIGFDLSETKEQLKLKYEVAVEDHQTGRVTVVFTLADEGRLAPLDEVKVAIPSQQKEKDGSYYFDLVIAMDMAKTPDGNRVGREHLRKDWAERAEIRLDTHALDGKTDPMTRLHHSIPVAKYMKKGPGTQPK